MQRGQRGEHEVDPHEEEQPHALQHARVEVDAAAAAAAVVLSSRVLARGGGGSVGVGVGVGGRRHRGEYPRQLGELEAGDRVPLRVDVVEGGAHQQRDHEGGDQIDQDEQRVPVRQPEVARLGQGEDQGQGRGQGQCSG